MVDMDKKEKIRLIVAIIINFLIFALEIYCLIYFIGRLFKDTDNRFHYYTNVSNLTVGLISLVSAIFYIISLVKKEMFYPKTLSIIKFMGLCMTTLTFFTVLLLIAPLTSYKEMYENVKFITHLVVPVIAMISYLFFEEKTHFEWKYSFFGMVPFAIYSIVYVSNVIYLQTWPDLYKINSHGMWLPLVIGFYIFNFGITQGVYFLKKIRSNPLPLI